MGINPPASNKIHSLPVLVVYHLPSSSSAFTALFPAKQQVYVHANGASKKSGGDGEEERWGSIPLKTVVQGVMLASPELHPFDSSTPDRSVYVLDTRETILRRQRTAIPSHLRTDRASSPMSSPSASSSSTSTTASEVWSGKGLVSWALNEPGSGKNLITGRLVKSTEFASISMESEGMGALEALMMSDQENGCWGLEVNISLRPQGMPMTGSLHAPVAPAVKLERQSSILSDSPVSIPNRSISSPPPSSIPTPPIRPQPPRPTSRPTPIQPEQTPGASSSTRKTRVPSKKRKAASSPVKPTEERALANINMNAESIARAVRADAFDPKLMLPDIPAAVYKNPSSLTKDQIHRLLASPAFLDLLEKTAGQTLVDTATAESALTAKRLKHDNGEECLENKCYDCGRTKSSVWRSRPTEDGVIVRVCNACGLYWNAKKEMRPPTLWSAVDDEVSERPRIAKPIIPRNPPTAPPITTARAAAAAAAKAIQSQSSPASSSSAGFKRTLSAVVNQDAARIASRRPSAPVRSNLNPNRSAPAPAPATSPAQSTRAKTMRNASWKNTKGEAASSPGGYANANVRTVKPNEAFSPLSTIREASATPMSSHSGIQSLQLPLSDDQVGVDGHWDTDISTLFDIDAFGEGLDDFSETAKHNQHTLRRSPRKHSNRNDSSYSSNSYSDKGNPQSEDVDPLSHLYRTTTNPTPKSKFDFSALPPSSPPYMQSGSSHGVLMSSPDFSPLSSMFGPSPVDHGPVRITPEKNKSGLRNSFTPIQDGPIGLGMGIGVGVGGMKGQQITHEFEEQNPFAPIIDQGVGGDVPVMSLEEITQALNESGMDQAAWDELFGLMSEVEAGGGVQMQVQDQGQGVVSGGNVDMSGMGDDWTTLFNTLSQ